MLGTGCRRTTLSQAAPAKRPATGLTGTANWAEKRRQGVDFVAVGNGPAAWHLDIDFSKQMRFETPDGPGFAVAAPRPKPSPKGLGVVFDAQSTSLLASLSRRSETGQRNTGRNRMTVSIEPVTYRDPLTKRDYAYTTRIETNGRQYVGGGIFIKSSNRLAGAWTLETFKGQRLHPEQFGDKALPVLTIDLSDGKLTGSTGWSKLKGNIRANGDQLSVTLKPVRQPSANEFESNFLEALQQASLFRVGKERLTLFVNGQYVMTLRKA